MTDARTRSLAVDTAHRIARGEPYEDDLLDRAVPLLRVDAGAALGQYSLTGERPDVITVAGGSRLPPEDVAFKRRSADRHPGWSVLGRPGAPRVVRLSDLVDLRRFWDTEAYAVFHEPEGGRYPANALLVANRRTVVFLALQRRARDFGDADVDRLWAVQRAAAAAFTFREALERAVAEVDGALFRLSSELDGSGPVVPVGVDYAPTRREEEVLALAADGWTNHRIAGQLGLSERTVRKHLSNVYDKSRTYSRAAAAAWWQRRQLW
jgi:DNA-binding CsgD family transcriptional regulator